jgi:predicted DNA-binding protein with PD1-like motif
MNWQLIADDRERTYVVVFDTGDELMQGLRSFARSEQITAASLTGIGGFSGATLAYFDWGSRSYQNIPVHEQVEVASLVGDIALKEAEPEVHLHAVVSDAMGRTVDGHVMNGLVRPTMEMMVTASAATLRRLPDEASGLALIRLPDRTGTAGTGSRHDTS